MELLVIVVASLVVALLAQVAIAVMWCMRRWYAWLDRRHLLRVHDAGR